MKSRVVTAFALLPLVLAAFAEPHGFGIWFLGVVVSCLAYGELCSISGEAQQRLPWLGLLLSLGCLYGGTVAPSWVLLVCLLLAFVLGVLTVGRASSGAWIQISGMWIFAPLLTIFMVHRLSEPHSAQWSLVRPAMMCVFPLWAGDTFGIIVGKLLGKHKLAPTISPAKTVEGAIGNLSGALLVGAPFGLLMGVPIMKALACCCAAGTLGQVGDLFESWIKRRYGAKDSGSLLPGHGGLLDRADSILFAAPIIALILALWT